MTILAGAGINRNVSSGNGAQIYAAQSAFVVEENKLTYSVLQQGLREKL